MTQKQDERWKTTAKNKEPDKEDLEENEEFERVDDFEREIESGVKERFCCH